MARVQPDSPEASLSLPTHCPFCASGSISASGQKITPSTYWRCESCSQLWNPERLRARDDRMLSPQSYRDWDRLTRPRP
jgi:transposase-like protein